MKQIIIALLFFSVTAQALECDQQLFSSFPPEQKINDLHDQQFNKLTTKYLMPLELNFVKKAAEQLHAACKTPQQKKNALALTYNAAARGDKESLYAIGKEFWLGDYFIADQDLAGKIFTKLAQRNFNQALTSCALWHLHKKKQTAAEKKEIKRLFKKGLLEQSIDSLRESINKTPTLDTEKNNALCEEVVAYYYEILDELLNDLQAQKMLINHGEKNLAATKRSEVQAYKIEKAIEKLFDVLQSICTASELEALMQVADFITHHKIQSSTLSAETLTQKAFILVFSHTFSLIERTKKLGLKKISLIINEIDRRIQQELTKESIRTTGALLAIRFALITEPTQILVPTIIERLTIKKNHKKPFTPVERPYFELLSLTFKALNSPFDKKISIADCINEILNYTPAHHQLGYTKLPGSEECLNFYRTTFKAPLNNTDILLKAHSLDPESCIIAHHAFHQRFLKNEPDKQFSLATSFAFLLLAFEQKKEYAVALGNFYFKYPALERTEHLGIADTDADFNQIYNLGIQYVNYHNKANECIHLREFLKQQRSLALTLKQLALYAYCGMLIFEISKNQEDFSTAFNYLIALVTKLDTPQEKQPELNLIISLCRNIVSKHVHKEYLTRFNLLLASKQFLENELKKIELINNALAAKLH